MDFSKIKVTAFQKYNETKNFLSKTDLWSSIESPSYFSFKVSPTTFNNIKNNPDTIILEENLMSGKFSILIETPDIRLDDFIVRTIQIIQDIDIKTSSYIYLASIFKIQSEFNTRNYFKQKDLVIFDIKLQDKKLIFKLSTSGDEYIELYTTIGQ
jgi:hypothetical protein